MNQLDYLNQARQNVSLSATKLDHYFGGDMSRDNLQTMSGQGTVLALGSAVGLMGTLLLASPAIIPALGAAAIAGVFSGGAMVVGSALYRAFRADKINDEKSYAEYLNNHNDIMLKDGTMSKMTHRDMMKKMADGTLYDEIHAVQIKGQLYKPENMTQVLATQGHTNPKNAEKLMAKAIVIEEKEDLGIVKNLGNKISSIREKLFGSKNDNKNQLKM
jgi:hypothetical protein